MTISSSWRVITSFRIKQVIEIYNTDASATITIIIFDIVFFRLNTVALKITVELKFIWYPIKHKKFLDELPSKIF